MSADFVVCSKDSTVLAVIELDDASHETDRQKARDAKKDRALNSAGIRLLRWSVRDIPNDEAIKAALQPAPTPLVDAPPDTRVKPTLRK